MSRPASISFRSENKDLLCVTGVKISTITAVTTFPGTTEELWSMLPFTGHTMIVSSLNSLWNARDSVSWTTEFVEELADTFTMGCINRDGLCCIREDYADLIQQYEHVKRGQVVENLASLCVKVSLLDRDQKTYLRSTRDQVINRAPFLHSDHRIGLGQLWQKPGDEICIVFGCSVPLILRPAGNHWRLIGDAYVRGVMKVSSKTNHG